MPTLVSENSADESNLVAATSPGSTTAKPGDESMQEEDNNSSSSNNNNNDDPMEIEEDQGETNPASTDDDDDDDSEEEDEEDSEDDDEVVVRRSRRVAKSISRRKNAAAASKKRSSSSSPIRRTSSRANKFTSSMAEPSIKSFRDLFIPGDGGRDEEEDDFMDEDSDEEEEEEEEEEVRVVRKPSRRGKRRGVKNDSSLGGSMHTNNSSGSPHKSPARRHAKMRLSLDKPEYKDDDDFSLEESSLETIDEEEDEDEEEPLKIQRILASRSETRRNWRDICQRMQTSEIEEGSRWFQANAEKDSNENNNNNNDDDEFEERFLVKWSDLSYLHCSWESQADLEDQIEGGKGGKGGAKTYLSTFFRKSENGLLFTADERCDGDYFDPAFTQIERILEIHLPEDGDYPPQTAENEDKFSTSDFGIIMDKSDPNYEEGTGRQFLIKWCNTPYSESSYEFERDLILNEIDYKEHVKSFLSRNTKPPKSDRKALIKKGEEEVRRLYKIFGDRSNISDVKKDEAVEKYKLDLQNKVFKNGGQVRDYQAEGIAWMISNFVNQRGSILADEMGLGKTLQCAATIDILTTKLNRVGPILIVAPLSTLAHWKREFDAWTDLNVIVYHGTAEDRRLIRELEFVYECDRPEGGVAFNQTYLKKCAPKKSSQRQAESPWMVQVVITTPDMIIKDDYTELTAAHWQVLVVDEAHRMKNTNSKLTVRLREDKFIFNHKILLTGTPIQNDVQEFWTLLNFIDPDSFDDMDDFMEKYGDMKSKERVDELHEEIRPYILRRLKEDVEKSVPPKEETLIEVELTVSQKQYYRALYEKNVRFLTKGKKKAIDGPSLLNLAMQLRKCCNHLFLLRGAEDDFRLEQAKTGEKISELEFLVKGSGKLVLLDKLLPRLKDEGHRVLLFSQFKIMLDILEDYLRARGMKFERIDGSITGNKRQQAIDRFQAPSVEGREEPFIMMLSTRAGGVGINLTAADTCIIFDSDFNPQNDLQAQARCHRIGQTKSVKVYRLLTRKTYEMQMFHTSSLKMGLDQAVLKGFESGASGEGSLSREEVEKLLRHGAYDILNEEKAGTAEAASNDFVQQDIDSILQRRSRTVIHENTGSKSNAAGGTFSKASFKMTKSPGSAGAKANDEDIDIEDPDFWKKMLGDPRAEETEDLTKKRRQRTKTNYDERALTRDLDAAICTYDDSSTSYTEDEEEEGEIERSRWGGSAANKEWKKEDVETLIKSILAFGYAGGSAWDDFLSRISLAETHSSQEIKRMSWSVALLALLEAAEDDVAIAIRREKQQAAKDDGEKGEKAGGVLADGLPNNRSDLEGARGELTKRAFEKLWHGNTSWLKRALEDAVTFARENEPREREQLEKSLSKKDTEPKSNEPADIATNFAKAWQSLKNRGWQAEVLTSGDLTGKTRYEFEGKQYWSYESVLKAASSLHPDLAQMCDRILELHNSSRQQSLENQNQERAQHLALTVDNADAPQLQSFLQKYAPLQLLADRTRAKKLRLSRRILTTCSLLDSAAVLVSRADACSGDSEAIDRLAASLILDKRSTLPHPMWTPRHDAILIHAISKHGWIDQDSVIRAIGTDPTIAWGMPFEVQASETVNSPEPPKEDGEVLLATANRAATFLNQNREMLKECKGFNQHYVQNAYGLTRHMPDEVESSLEFEPAPALVQPWIVNETKLEGSSASTLGMNQREPVDLPEKKDLLKRAKSVLSRCVAGEAATSANTQAEVRPSYGFSVLDQSYVCNILLAEMLRGLLKAPSKHSRKLCAAAQHEALIRLQSLQAQKSSNNTEEKNKAAAEMERIVRHIDLVKRNISKSARQYKNVLRVILGEEPQQGRGSDEELFPANKTTASFISAKASSSKKPSIIAKASGERAIEDATRRLFAAKAGDNGQMSVENNSLDLTEIETLILSVGIEWNHQLSDLTEIETLILSVVCSQGLPVWTKNWRDTLTLTSLGSPGRTSGPLSPYTLTWAEVGRSVSNLAQEAFRREKTKLTKARKDCAKHTEGQSPSNSKENAEQLLFNAERLYVFKEHAAGQADDYASEPETLAKKAIMMLAKVERCMGRQSNNATYNGLGPKVMDWFVNEIHNWASSLDLLDNRGRPLGFTAVDFIDDVNENERATIEISAIMDKKGCRGVASQTAVMTRTRSLFMGYEVDLIPARLEKAAAKIRSAGDKWALQPDWWTNGGAGQNANTSHHDRLLLLRLLRSGFADVLDDTDKCGLDVVAASVSFKDAGLTRQSVQMRANQLARELHALESGEIRKKASHPNKSKASHQTGLASIFGATAGTSNGTKKPAPAIDNSEVQVIQPPLQPPLHHEATAYSDVEILSPTNPKRKDDGKAPVLDLSESPDKKLRAS